MTTDNRDLRALVEAAPRPDWNDAPEWAQWLTYDRDGWYWHENEPALDGDGNWVGFYESNGRTEGIGQEPRPGQFIKDKRP